MRICIYKGNDAPSGCQRKALRGWTTCGRQSNSGPNYRTTCRSTTAERWKAMSPTLLARLREAEFRLHRIRQDARRYERQHGWTVDHSTRRDYIDACELVRQWSRGA
jgi:hypothetical protein